MPDCIGAAGTVAFKAWKRWMIPMPRSGLGGRGGAPRFSFAAMPKKQPASADYGALLVAVKERVRAALYQILKAVNNGLDSLYWNVRLQE